MAKSLKNPYVPPTSSGSFLTNDLVFQEISVASTGVFLQPHWKLRTQTKQLLIEVAIPPSMWQICHIDGGVATSINNCLVCVPSFPPGCKKRPMKATEISRKIFLLDFCSWLLQKRRFSGSRQERDFVLVFVGGEILTTLDDGDVVLFLFRFCFWFLLLQCASVTNKHRHTPLNQQKNIYI